MSGCDRTKNAFAEIVSATSASVIGDDCTCDFLVALPAMQTSDLMQRRKRCPPLAQTRIDPMAICGHPPHVDQRQLHLEAGYGCQFFAAPESLHRSRTKWCMENLNGAVVYVSFAASISASRPAALGRKPRSAR